MLVHWEAAYASQYKVQLSTDGTSWTDISGRTSGDGDTDTHGGLNATGRYLRILGTQRATEWGYSIWELEVFGVRNSNDTTPPSAPTGLQVTGTTANSASLTWSPSTDNIAVTAAWPCCKPAKRWPNWCHPSCLERCGRSGECQQQSWPR